jgi:hypothetical protein
MSQLERNKLNFVKSDFLKGFPTILSLGLVAIGCVRHAAHKACMTPSLKKECMYDPSVVPIFG